MVSPSNPLIQPHNPFSRVAGEAERLTAGMATEPRLSPVIPSEGGAMLARDMLPPPEHTHSHHARRSRRQRRVCNFAQAIRVTL
jgi:hypothetical protein